MTPSGTTSVISESSARSYGVPDDEAWDLNDRAENGSDIRHFENSMLNTYDGEAARSRQRQQGTAARALLENSEQSREHCRRHLLISAVICSIRVRTF